MSSVAVEGAFQNMRNYADVVIGVISAWAINTCHFECLISTKNTDEIEDTPSHLMSRSMPSDS